MPEMDGYELCRRLQERPDTAYVPVIFATGRADAEDRSKAFLVGGADFIAKPLQEPAFLRTVAAHVGTRRKWSEVRRIADAKPAALAAAPACDPFASAERWDWKLNPTGFKRFLDFLAARVKIPADRAKTLVRVGPAGLYPGAAELGIPARAVAEALAAYLNLPLAARVNADEIRLGVLPGAFCRQNHVVALQDPSGAPSFVVSNPFHWEVLEALRRIVDAGKAPKLRIVEPAGFAPLVSGAAKQSTMSEIQAELRKEFEIHAGSETADSANLDSGPLVELVHRVIEAGFDAGASDIHIEPSETEIVIRYRIDGDLHVVNRLTPPAVGRRVIARLKVMSGLDLAEHRLPQDGRIAFRKFSRAGSDFDLRVAILPVAHGEKACLRIIDKQKSVMPLEKLGFHESNLRQYRAKIKAPYGLILHVGPTGSGKSMSLYAALNEIMDSSINIQTAEDPIEYTLKGINQVQVNPEIGFTFARALRSFLRMDPDIILVGEIRDQETAKTAIEASLTGHLVFSTLHTNDAATTVTRFLEMGVDPFLVSNSLVLVCAQRLLRRLCPDCKEARDASPEERRLLGVEGPAARIWSARGCDRCNRIGYKGRIAVHELMAPDAALRAAINRPGVTAEIIEKLAVEGAGMTTLWADASRKVLAGVCSLEDALANVAPDELAAPEPAPAGRRGEAA
jgi:type IV pilus assembly protein PilB